MAGHNKWSKIRHKKGANDVKRGKIFTKIGKLITVAAKQGGDDPSMNPALRDAISKAKSNNMPNENINRCIKKASTDTSNQNYENIIYEGYGISGSAVIVTVLTDNKNKAAGEVRHLFDKYGGSLGTKNSVSFMFDRKGLIVVDKLDNQINEELMFNHAIKSGANDIIDNENEYEIYTDPNIFTEVKDYLEGKNITFINADIEYVPQSTVSLDSKDLKSFNKMISLFEDNDDVQEVYHNVNNVDEIK